MRWKVDGGSIFLARSPSSLLYSWLSTGIYIRCWSHDLRVDITGHSTDKPPIAPETLLLSRQHEGYILYWYCNPDGRCPG